MAFHIRIYYFPGTGPIKPLLKNIQNRFMRAEDSGSYSQNVYIFILNNSQPQVNSGYCTGVWTRHNLVIFYVIRKESSTKRTQQRIFWFWGTKSNGNTWEICIYRLWCLAAPIPATPIYRLREKCRPCVSTNEIPWKKNWNTWLCYVQHWSFEHSGA